MKNWSQKASESRPLRLIILESSFSPFLSLDDYLHVKMQTKINQISDAEYHLYDFDGAYYWALGELCRRFSYYYMSLKMTL